HPPLSRLALLEEFRAVVESRDDLYLELATLCNTLGRYEEARQLIASRIFHPWEGGEGKVVSQYLLCHTGLAKQALQEGDAAKALQLLQAAKNYPDNLGEGKLTGAQENDIFYLEGLAHEQLNNAAAARTAFRAAAEGISEPVQAIFYNDPQPDKIFYQGLAQRKLGHPDKATEIFERLAAFGERHMQDVITIDYFAVSLPDLLVFDADLDQRNAIHCRYMLALGCLGMGQQGRALALFDEVLELDIHHQGAAVHRQMALDARTTLSAI
ncbi:MAG: tetratricopeptide repeat protein, partial [Bacteroidetes bacterium]|nr:tetratricopeptide repeat protein [Bacteroidota bacterium]